LKLPDTAKSILKAMKKSMVGATHFVAEALVKRADPPLVQFSPSLFTRNKNTRSLWAGVFVLVERIGLPADGQGQPANFNEAD
jgi:hypothetical protein